MGRVKHSYEVEGDNSIELTQSRERSIIGGILFIVALFIKVDKREYIIYAGVSSQK